MNRENLLLSIASIMLILIVITTGCQAATTPSTPSEETINIGVASSITGVAAFIGGHMGNAIMLAIEDHNAKGGVTIGGKKYKLSGIVRDTKSDPAIGKTIAEELVDVYKVKAIAGPFAIETPGMQPVTEANKVIGFWIAPSLTEQASAKNMYSYWVAGPFESSVTAGLAFIHEFYPDKTKVVGMSPDIIDLAMVQAISEKNSPKYGLNWLAMEKFPTSTTDFMPVIQRVLDLKPDVVDTTSTVGSMGPAGPLLVKQLREAGFKGPILMRGNPPTDIMLQVVGKDALEGCIDSGLDPQSPLVTDAYRDLIARYEKKYNIPFMDVVGEYYNTTNAFLNFLNTQNTLDTTQWTEAFAKYKWTGVFGDSFWGGAPKYSGNRVCFNPRTLSEWHNGKRETKFVFKLPANIEE